MEKTNNVEKLKQELKDLKERPILQSEDGMPSLFPLVFGFPLAYLRKYIKIKKLKNKLKKLGVDIE
jgi:hypothetical protein